MNKFLKIIGAIVALAGIAAAIYFAVQKLYRPVNKPAALNTFKTPTT